jgi:hypothetical protein
MHARLHELQRSVAYAECIQMMHVLLDLLLTVTV